MFVDTGMPHMRKQEILQNYKTFPITALQTHTAEGKKTKQKENSFGVEIPCVSEAPG